YTNEDATAQTVNIASIVDAQETLTSLVDNGDGTISYTDEDSVEHQLDISTIAGTETVTNLIDNGDGSITYTNEEGTDQTLDLLPFIQAQETLTTLVDNGDGTITYTDEDGVETLLNIAVIGGAETVTNLIDNGDGSITYTNEAGTDQTLDLLPFIQAQETLTTLVDNGDGTITYTDEDSVVHQLDIATIVGDETVTNLIDNGDGSITYTNEEGTEQTLDLAPFIQAQETLTSLVDNGDGTLTYTDEDNSGTDIDIANIVESEETLTVLNVTTNDNGTGSDPSDDFDQLTYQDENGTAHAIDLSTVATQETVTSLVDNGDGTITYTDEAGDEAIISIPTPGTNGLGDIAIGELRAFRASASSADFASDTSVRPRMTGKLATQFSNNTNALLIETSGQESNAIVFDGLRMDLLYHNNELVTPVLVNTTNEVINYTIVAITTDNNYAQGSNTEIAPQAISYLIDGNAHISASESFRSEMVIAQLIIEGGGWYKLTYVPTRINGFTTGYWTALRLQ
ncbi:MAG: hypothetical protein HRT65_16375, partial [Flavobacteriaceae bacterium]|nr:hypothetical protein [Flavobacteriaceae bacterium]